MRLVSAIWKEYHPFDHLRHVDSLGQARSSEDLKEGDILVVWGGEDIHPSLYDRPKSRYSGAGNRVSNRDIIEWSLMARARALKVPIIGVCRGAQMLCAFAGGILIQHVNGHGGYHNVLTHDGQLMVVNSLHHQMMYPSNTNHNLIAWSEYIRSNVHYDVDDSIPVEKEPEFVYFPDVRGFAIQWHPEMMEADTPSTVYMNSFIEKTLDEL